MKKNERPGTPVKTRQLISRALVLAWMLSGCSFFGEQAPLSDGLYLNYDFAGSSIQVTFSAIDANTFRATLNLGPQTGGSSGPASAGNQKIVDKQLKTERGMAYEAGILGPVWIAPSSVKKGGRAHGDKVHDVREWNGWQVGVVRASFGRGALSGEWYYEKNTGFLVGGKRQSITDDTGATFVLTGSNLPGLSGKSE